MEQRLVELSYTAGSGVLNVSTPPDGNVAPPGYYMLFVLNSAGVPSIARFVQLLPSAPTQRPTPMIEAPATDVTISAGDSAFFAGSGSDPTGIIAYSWTFPGGNPASSPGATPGNVSYSTAGIYVASLSVTNKLGLTSQIPATRVIRVSDFAVSAGPTTQSVLPAGSAAYVAGITSLSGFAGTVGFAVSGLPAGATASFSPSSIVGSAFTTLQVSTSSTTPLGTHPLTITATSGPITHTAAMTLVVSTCVDTLTLNYAAPTLNAGFRLGTTAPATWSTWLVAANMTWPLWAISVPVVSPAVLINVPLTPFPSIGTVYVVTTLSTTAGTTCWDWKGVNTSP